MGKFFLVLGRIFLSLIFLIAVVYQILNWEATHQYFACRISDWLTHPQLPVFLLDFFNFLLSYGSIAVILATIFSAVGGLLVLLGIQVRLGAILLILFLIPTTLFMHSFWLYQGAEFNEQMTNFFKNLAILGGLFILAFFGDGE